MVVKKDRSATDERQFLSSTHREKVVEHVFLGELLRHLWVARIHGVQVLKPEVDAAGYDLVLTLGKVIRHVQLKTSMHDAKARSQLIHDSLGEHPSGCIVWIRLKDDLTFDHFLWFGGEPGRPLPSLTEFRRARHTRGRDEDGERLLRAHTWQVPKSEFESVAGLAGLVGKLFGKQAGAASGGN